MAKAAYLSLVRAVMLNKALIINKRSRACLNLLLLEESSFIAAGIAQNVFYAGCIPRFAISSRSRRRLLLSLYRHGSRLYRRGCTLQKSSSRG